MDEPVAVILAAGKSTRMKSELPKVIHPIFGRPMADYVLESARAAGVKRMVIVVGHEADKVKAALSHHPDVEFALQAEQHGTGHAVMVCQEHLADHNGPLLVLAGDTPLLKAESLRGLLEDQARDQAGGIIGTAVTDNNHGLGRIVRDSEGEFVAIVEQKDATPEQQAIREINTGCYAFDCQSLLGVLDRLQTNNTQGEYYLTDCPSLLKADGKPVRASHQFDLEEAMGVNTRVQLAAVRQAIQSHSCEQWMLSGVTIVDPNQVSLDPQATIGKETVIHPFVQIEGPAVIGEGCEIAAYTQIRGPVELPAGTRTNSFQVVASNN